MLLLQPYRRLRLCDLFYFNDLLYLLRSSHRDVHFRLWNFRLRSVKPRNFRLWNGSGRSGSIAAILLTLRH